LAAVFVAVYKLEKLGYVRIVGETTITVDPEIHGESKIDVKMREVTASGLAALSAARLHYRAIAELLEVEPV
jgi:hypothetical protein